MIKRILVTTDGSESSAVGVRYAVALAAQENASVMVLHVVDVKLLEGPFLRDLSASLGAAPYVNYQGNIAMLLDERGKAALEYGLSLCKRNGVPCETELQTGIVPGIIVEKGQLADLIVMGRAGEHTEFLEGFIGSTTEAVVRRASVPVLVTGRDVPDADRVLLAYDSSVHAKKALRTAADLVEETPRRLTVLVVGGKNCAQWLDETQEYLKSRNMQVNYVQKSGEPGEEIVHYAAEYDAGLLVMGAYGHSKLREMVLGSTTSYAINHAPCPILLIR